VEEAAMTVDETIRPESDDLLRDRALKRLKKRRDFHAHLLIYVLVNASIVIVWLFTSNGTFFWPIFIMAFWGIGVVMNAWDVYRGEDFTEDEIKREMQKLAS
jgi:hypothetical protein